MSKRPIKSPTHYVTLMVYDPQEIYEMMKVNDFYYFDELRVNLGSARVKLFRDNPYCVKCGVKGTEYRLQRHGKERNDAIPHLNMYGYDNANQEVLMTKDHIIPKSKGGRNDISNYQTLCFICNANKADKVE